MHFSSSARAETRAEPSSSWKFVTSSRVELELEIWDLEPRRARAEITRAEPSSSLDFWLVQATSVDNWNDFKLSTRLFIQRKRKSIDVEQLLYLDET